MFTFAIDEGLMEIDPSRDVKAPKGEVKGHRQWSLAEIETFRNFWPNGSKERIAFELIYWTGACCVDAATLGAQMMDRTGWIEFIQSKTGGAVTIPISAPLPNWASTLKADQDHLLRNLPADMQWITTNIGKPRSVKGLSQWFSGIASDAGLA